MTKYLNNPKWDGSFIGELDEYVINRRTIGNIERVGFWILNNKGFKKIIEVRLIRYKDEIPLIADELKTLFQINKVGMHKAILKGEEYIISQATNDVLLEEYFSEIKRSAITPLFMIEMRKIFAFRWLVCLNCNFESKIEVRINHGLIFPVSCYETTFSLDSGSSKCRIPNTIIKDWFDNDDEILEKTVKFLLEDKDPTLLKFEIQKIINKYSNRHIAWVNAIYEKLLRNF